MGRLSERNENARIYNMYICGRLCGDYDLLEYRRKQVLDLDTATRLSELSFLPILTIASRISY